MRDSSFLCKRAKQEIKYLYPSLYCFTTSLFQRPADACSCGNLGEYDGNTNSSCVTVKCQCQKCTQTWRAQCLLI